MSDKIYCGSAKIVKTKFGEMPKILFHKDNINTIVKYMKDNNVDFINLDMKEKKDKQEGKHTHYLEVDTWKPETNPAETDEANLNPETDDLPF